MLRIIFLETSLELIPKEILEHPAVVKDAKRRKKHPTKILLDDSKHHSAMQKLKNRWKRGRPDIAHYCLLSLLDSKIDKMDIYIHTINNELIWINRKTRLPRNYNRFIGLMENLFEKKAIKAGDEILMEIKNCSISDLLFSTDTVVLMTEHGNKNERDLKNLIRNDENLTVCIGGFPHGNFSEEVLQLMEKVGAKFVSLGNESLTSLYVTNRVICIYENERIQTY